MRRWLSRLLMVVMVALISGLAGVTRAQDEGVTRTYDGFIDDDVTAKTYTFEMRAGQAVAVLAEATSGDLDTFIRLFDPDGDLISENDDYGFDSFDSALGYVAEVSGTYTLEMTRYEGEFGGGSSGYFQLSITLGDPIILEEFTPLIRVELSGDMLRRETEHFVIHYTERGGDRVEEGYVDDVAEAVELAWQIQVEQLGWPAPPSDNGLGGDARYDIYLKEIVGSESTLGYTARENIVGDNPNSPDVETAAATSYIVLDNDYDDTEDTSSDSIGLMRTTMIHEFNHALQFGFDGQEPTSWIFEATAVWMETAGAGKDQDATGYIEYAYTYPELCFGTIDDPQDGLLQYGEWTFVQSLIDQHGDNIVIDVWESFAKYDGFEAIERALAPYNDTLVNAMERMRVQDLARDYALAPEFNATVYLEETITDTGRWTYSGQGIQELGTNYFRVDVDAGEYSAALINDNGDLRLWAIGIIGNTLEATPLERGGNFDTSLYDDMYLMVFNPDYDDDLTDCIYEDYDIEVRPASSGRVSQPTLTFSARYYEALD